MKRVKIFVASSVNEFAEERLILKDFARRLSDKLIDYDVRIRLFICEYADNAMAEGRMQEEYNREIENSDLFFLIAGHRLGAFTLEEYLYALDVRAKMGLPHILVALQKCRETEVSVQSFAQRLDTDPAEQIRFDTVGELKKL